MDWLLLLAQIFGGCCTNVYLFETLLASSENEDSIADIGLLVTVCQFALVSLVSVPPLIDTARSSWKGVYLQRRHIPLAKLVQCVLMFYALSVLNNTVWRFGLSVPVHIMFRSSGALITMVIGTCFGGKTYTRDQVKLAVMITVSATIAILDTLRATRKGQTVASSSQSGGYNLQFFLGVMVLLLATVIGAFNGLHSEKIYRKYGNHWREMLFYTHVLALPLFLVQGRSIFTDFRAVWNSSPTITILEHPPIVILHQFAYLLLNCVTQVLCARGVNQLCGVALSLTVTIVLLIRKFVSLALSAYLFGHHFTHQGQIGAIALVWYSIEYARATRKQSQEEKKSREGKKEKIREENIGVEKKKE